MVSRVFVNIIPGNGLSPGSTKPSPEPVLSYDQYRHAASPEDNSTGNVQYINDWMTFENWTFRITDTSPMGRWVNTMRSRQNVRHFADNIFKCIFLNEDIWISINISMKFVSKSRINNIPALVQIMAWRRLSDKPLSDPMMVNLQTHICVGLNELIKTFNGHICIILYMA